MELKELIIIISLYNSTNEYDILCRDASDYGIRILSALSEVSNPKIAFLITDSREAADEAKLLGIGFSVYLNEKSRASDFADSLYLIEDLGDVGTYRIIRMYQRHHNIPWHILNTKRLSLTEMCADDLDDIYGVYDDPLVGMYAGEPYYDRDKALDYINSYTEYQYRFYEYGIWLVRDRLTGEVIGRAGLTGRAGYEDAELGYVFAKRVWGRGYATEAIDAIIKYSKEELYMERLNAFVMPENEASLHILAKFGFKEKGMVVLHDVKHIYMQLEL